MLEFHTFHISLIGAPVPTILKTDFFGEAYLNLAEV